MMKLRFCAALLVAAAFTNPFSAAAWAKVWRAINLWFDYGRGPKRAPNELYELRLAACRECPIFYAPLQTCGSPLRKDLRGLGCYCNMPAKARFFYADCWLRENTGDGDCGWPDTLRRFEPDFPDSQDSRDGAASSCGDVGEDPSGR